MKASEAKKLIGKKVTWVDTICPKRGGLVRFGVLIEIRGKNAFMDQCGFTEWKWLPDLVGLKAVDEVPQ